MRKPTVRTLAVLIVLLAAAMLTDAFLIEHRHVEFPWQRVPGHQGIIGLVAALVVIVASRAIGEVLGTKESSEESPDA